MHKCISLFPSLKMCLAHHCILIKKSQLIYAYKTNFMLIEQNVIPYQEMSGLKRISHGSELSQLSEGVLVSKIWSFHLRIFLQNLS